MRDFLNSLLNSEPSPRVHFTADSIKAKPVQGHPAAQESIQSYNAVANLMRAALLECGPPAFAEATAAHPCFTQACVAAHEDLHAFLSKDPAQHGSPIATLFGSTSYKATLHYRLAHALMTCAKLDAAARHELEACAWLVSHRGKLLSGAEIHPGCDIGQRFILDHGWGTVIGETSVIGNDCYLLGGVTLGATGIANNTSMKRHPTLGDRVQIGAFSRIFGDIHIGDDVFVGAHCTVTQSIMPNSTVTLRSKMQIIRTRASSTPT